MIIFWLLHLHVHLFYYLSILQSMFLFLRLLTLFLIGCWYRFFYLYWCGLLCLCALKFFLFLFLFLFRFMLMLHILLSFSQLLFFTKLLLSFMQHPLSTFQPLLLSLSPHYPPVMLSRLCIYLQSQLSHKWVLLKIIAFPHPCAFLLIPFPCTSLLDATVIVAAPCGVASLSGTSHSIGMMTRSLSLEEL